MSICVKKFKPRTARVLNGSNDFHDEKKNYCATRHMSRTLAVLAKRYALLRGPSWGQESASTYKAWFVYESGVAGCTLLQTLEKRGNGY